MALRASEELGNLSDARKVEVEEVDGRLYLAVRIPITISPEQIEISLPEANRLKGLSPREIGVLKMILAGKQNKEIADEMALSVYTVKAHVGSLLRKTECASRDALRSMYTTAMLFKAVSDVRPECISTGR